jgi:hypothetical protein
MPHRVSIHPYTEYALNPMCDLNRCSLSGFPLSFLNLKQSNRESNIGIVMFSSYRGVSGNPRIGSLVIGLINAERFSKGV